MRKLLLQRGGDGGGLGHQHAVDLHHGKHAAGNHVGEGFLLVPVASHVYLLHAVRDALLLELHPDLLAVRTPRGVVAVEEHAGFFGGAEAADQRVGIGGAVLEVHFEGHAELRLALGDASGEGVPRGGDVGEGDVYEGPGGAGGDRLVHRRGCLGAELIEHPAHAARGGRRDLRRASRRPRRANHAWRREEVGPDVARATARGIRLEAAMRTRVRQGVDVDARTAVGDDIGAVARREAERPPHGEAASVAFSRRTWRKPAAPAALCCESYLPSQQVALEPLSPARRTPSRCPRSTFARARFAPRRR